ncbi:hypothetical protein REPUB_Repub17cG0006600 [Reevesia pubescens]
MSWFFLVLFFSFIFSSFSEGSHDKKQSAIVVGTVYCDTCFQEDFTKTSHFISGAYVAVQCEDGTSRPSFRQEVKTNRHGKFKVHLPFSVSKNVKKIKGCSVKLIRSSEPYCGVASTATSSSLHLKSRKQGIHIFSAGFFTFKPLKQPILCNQKPNVESPKQLYPNQLQPPNPFLPPPILPPNPFQPPPLLPPNPFQPPPLLPPNPFQPPPAPLIPNPFQPPPAPLFPNPFQPPPAPLIPNPFQPPPAPLLPPNPFRPPPSPLFPFPPIPGLTPPPSPPPPAAFPFPLPPFPFLPMPPFPGLPPSSTSP